MRDYPARAADNKGAIFIVSVLFTALGLFAVALLVHVAVWRIRVPRQQAATLIVVILLVGIAGFGLLVSLGLQDVGPYGARLLLAIGVFGGLAAVYLILFSALEADSPTLTMINLIQAAGVRGIREDALRLAMSRHSYVNARIDQLLQDKMVIDKADGLQIQPSGRLLCAFILSYRRLLLRTHAGG
jgi:hypothetical protein